MSAPFLGRLKENVGFSFIYEAFSNVFGRLSVSQFLDLVWC